MSAVVGGRPSIRHVRVIIVVAGLFLPPAWATSPVGTADTQCAVNLVSDWARRRGVDLNDQEAQRQWLHVESLRGAPWNALPFTVFRAELTLRRPGVRAVFVAERDECRLLGGSLDQLLNLSIGWNDAVAFTMSQYNAAVQGVRPTSPISEPNTVIDLSRAVLSLASPVSSAVILMSTDDIPRLRPNQNHTRENRRVLRDLRDKIVPPNVERGSGVLRVRLWTWDEIGGIVWENNLLIFSDWRVSLSRTAVASKVGAFKPFEAEM